jgi:WD40 repeat protein
VLLGAADARGVERVGYHPQLFTVTLGGDTRRLTHGRSGHGSTVWAPGGRRIATVGKDHDPEVLARDGRLLRRFDGDGHSILGLTWSPDGRKLAFAPCRRREGETGCRLVTVSVSGNKRKQIASRLAGDPYWSPVGRTIFYARGPTSLPDTGPSGRDLYSVPSKGGTPRKLVEDVREFRGVSPDGQWLLFTRPNEGVNEEQVWIARTDGSDQRMLVERLQFGRFGWAPGKRGVWTLRYGGSHFHPVVISTSGERRRLGAKIASLAFAWSADGKRIGWGIDGAFAGQAQVRSSRPDGSGFRILGRIDSKGFAEIDAVSWSPDNRTLAVVAHRHEGD